ncbi:MAG: class I SAM-dependent RNA methyltransferase [Bacteriovoracaceae bacterium]|nr:class I SAM-dependent RNA methyltransferase [Bacteriovoracaceae bacterium]
MKDTFKIENMDTLGQGVSKKEGKVLFIKKVLPEEQGEATILRSAKGVHFGKVKKLEQTSPKRIEPECEHFQDCPGCDYLHTSYENEFAFKRESFQRIFSFLKPINDIDYIAAKNRLHYRNRVQLHYHQIKNQFGFVNSLENKIVSIPNCQITVPPLAVKIRELTESQNWRKLCQKPEGHLEFYYTGNEVKIQADARYSHEGFTQVNSEMNQVLIEYLDKVFEEQKFKNVVELFAGDGNLTKKQKFSYHLMVDYYTKTPADKTSLNLDLYSPKALAELQKKLGKNSIDCLLLDPPRSGFKTLNEWTECLQPRTILYVSCDPQTLARDLRSLKRPYQVKKLALLDLFPSTHHFESVSFIAF